MEDAFAPALASATADSVINIRKPSFDAPIDNHKPLFLFPQDEEKLFIILRARWYSASDNNMVSLIE